MKPLVLLMSCLILPALAAEPAHLFILSGQSNMARLDPNVSFIPAVAEAFGEERVIVVKDAVGGRPIRQWYKDWKPANGTKPEKNGDLYDRLLAKVREAGEGRQLATVTFLWMQGERDAREKHGEVYQGALEGLLKQLQEDLEREDLNVVIGRLSDFDLENRRYPHWTMIREAQMAFCEGHPERVWVDTDDLNDITKGDQVRNDLHYTKPGYQTFGQRLAEQAIALVKRRLGDD